MKGQSISASTNNANQQSPTKQSRGFSELFKRFTPRSKSPGGRNGERMEKTWMTVEIKDTNYHPSDSVNAYGIVKSPTSASASSPSSALIHNGRSSDSSDHPTPLRGVLGNLCRPGSNIKKSAGPSCTPRKPGKLECWTGSEHELNSTQIPGLKALWAPVTMSSGGDMSNGLLGMVSTGNRGTLSEEDLVSKSLTGDIYKTIFQRGASSADTRHPLVSRILATSTAYHSQDSVFDTPSRMPSYIGISCALSGYRNYRKVDLKMAMSPKRLSPIGMVQNGPAIGSGQGSMENGTVTGTGRGSMENGTVTGTGRGSMENAAAIGVGRGKLGNAAVTGSGRGSTENGASFGVGQNTTENGIVIGSGHPDKSEVSLGQFVMSQAHPIGKSIVERRLEKFQCDQPDQASTTITVSTPKRKSSPPSTGTPTPIRNLISNFNKMSIHDTKSPLVDRPRHKPPPVPDARPILNGTSQRDSTVIDKTFQQVPSGVESVTVCLESSRKPLQMQLGGRSFSGRIEEGSGVNGRKELEIAVEECGQNGALADKTGAVGTCDGEAMTKDGLYYQYEAAKERARLEKLCGNVEVHLDNVEMPEEAAECVRMAVGKVRLLLRKKFSKFEELIRNNLDPKPNDPRPTLVSDLEGYYELVKIEIEDIDACFEKVRQLKENSWKQVPSKDTNDKSQTKPANLAQSTNSKLRHPEQYKKPSGDKDQAANARSQAARQRLKEAKEAAMQRKKQQESESIQ